MTTKNLTPYLLLAATTLIVTPLLLVSCNSAEDSAETSFTPTESQPVAFGAYLNRATTRGGTPGELTTDGTSGTTKSLQTLGFGVFGYYTDDAPYSLSALPNFMYNQQVTYVTDHWAYSPVKYWPNETGSAAQSVGIDRLSFFAYAPYTPVDAAIGYALDPPVPPSTEPTLSNTCGIVALTRANENGYPYVRYYASTDPSECVDLCWADPTGTINLTKPDIANQVSFNFKHALAALNVQIDADVDVVNSHNPSSPDDHSTVLKSGTRIWVRSITFTGFATKGELNLYNGAWNNIECDCDVTSDPITIHDGRWDGYEGMSESLNEKPTGLNPAIVQFCSYSDLEMSDGDWSTKYSTLSRPTGVTNDAVNLFNDDTETTPIYVIPTNVPIRITIVYDVETIDNKLVTNFLGDGVTNGSSIQNAITAYVKNSSSEDLKMEAGKQYTIKLHLGMTSVKVTASVAEWDTTSPASVDIDLPNNQ